MAVGIDIGSNSLRAVKIDCETLKKVKEYEKVVGTALELEKSKEIQPQAVENILLALKEAKERVGFNDKVKAVATAAFRKAKNGKEVIEKIEKESGIRVEIISSDEECFYSAKGVEYGLKQKNLPDQKFLLADIGGGSTELIFKHRDELVFRSFGVGIISAVEKYKDKDRLRFGLKKEMRPIKEFLNDLYELFSKPKVFVGTGGTPATVAALKLGMVYETYDSLKVSGTKISIEDIQKAYKQLLILTPQQRSKLVGVGREEAIMAGLIILEELMEIAGYKEMVVSDEGVREGVALELCNKNL
ncbi:MAG: phosphatase [Epsilonproteobacteria bacterium]|nr:phosphatase [Campylobacterota bacterium]